LGTDWTLGTTGGRDGGAGSDRACAAIAAHPPPTPPVADASDGNAAEGAEEGAEEGADGHHRAAANAGTSECREIVGGSGRCVTGAVSFVQ
jgi:hypothetical protein